jgi:dipeptidyl aminopeptidase/acylaminoacyl peptidase
MTKPPRSILNSSARIFLFAGLVSTAALLRPESSNDLKRLTPVPDTEQIPVGDFLRPALLGAPTLNPSGTKIAALVSGDTDHRLLLVYDVKTQKYATIGGSGDYDISNVFWLGDSRVAYSVDAQKLYGIGLFAANVGDLDNTYPLLQYLNTSVVSVPRSDRSSPLVWNRYDGLRPSGQDEGVALVNSNMISGTKGMNILTAHIEAIGEIVEVTRDNNQKHISDRYPVPDGGNTMSYVSDKDGNLEFAVTNDNNKKSLHRLTADRTWVPCPVDMNNGYLCGAGSVPGQLVGVQGHTEGKPNALLWLESATGKYGDALVADKDYDFVGWPYRDPNTGVIIGAHVDREGPHFIWFTDTYKKYQDLLNRSFPGLCVRILDSNEAETLFLVATYSDRQPARYIWVDFSKHAAGLFKDSAPWINPKRMQPENIIRFKTRDGHQLDAYLTLPAGASKDHPVPLVVIPHGGPFVRDSWGFDGEAQLLASRGYAVVKPNYRASPGYQWKFPEADLWDFVKMSNDVTDVTKAMIATGFVDRSRIAIMGGSFGGYLTLKGLVDEPDLYHCGVAISGVFDWQQLMEDKKYDATQYGSGEYGQLMSRLGDPRKDPAKFDAIAPVRHVDKVKVPVFVSHGRSDDNVDVGQATRLIDELKRYHVPYEADIVFNEGHGMHYFSNRVDQYTRILAFLQKYVPANPAP